jgi:hypothetical protein
MTSYFPMRFYRCGEYSESILFKESEVLTVNATYSGNMQWAREYLAFCLHAPVSEGAGSLPAATGRARPSSMRRTRLFVRRSLISRQSMRCCIVKPRRLLISGHDPQLTARDDKGVTNLMCVAKRGVERPMAAV